MEIIRTQRLIIRSFKESDGPMLYEYLSDEDAVKFEPYAPFSWEAAQKEAFRRTQDSDFLAVCLPSDKLIGNLYLSERDCGSWETGYIFNKLFWGQGYALESFNAALDIAFKTLSAHRVLAMCDPLNERSWKLLKRAGMRREGTLLQNVYFTKDKAGQPIWKDTYIYAMLRDEFENMQRNSSKQSANIR